MPRIDPVKLLECLSVLLSPTGGIKSKEEVQRLAGLMTKFSKKLVSKCIYIQILKKTGTELLGSFMSAGGWTLVHMWLSDGIVAKNWPLIKELLELLLLCPVDVERLKTNNFPKLVKELSKDSSQSVVQALASKLVEQWLKLVKGQPAPPLILDEIPKVLNELFINPNDEIKNECDSTTTVVKDDEQNTEDDVSLDERLTDDRDESDSKNNVVPILKISVKHGKQVVLKVKDKSEVDRKQSKSDKKHISAGADKDSDKKKKDSRNRSSSSSRSSSTKHKNSVKSSSSSGDRRHSSSSDSNSKSKDKYKSSSSHREADKYKSKKESDREKSDRKNDKNKEQSDKMTESEKSQEQLNKLKLQSMSIMKLGKIPKKSSSVDKTDVTKEKPSISIEVRNPNDSNRPKTVKMFNSKFRSHGLEEEAKPPPPRGSVKKPSITTLPALAATKRSSPIRSMDAPPEKKPKIVDPTERPGAIKLIPPKSKPTYLLESESFMDALTASATNKKEPRKRKRRISGSKDNPTQGDVSPPTSPSSNPTTPTSPVVEESKSTPLRFYQDTLDTEEDDKKEAQKSDEDIKNEVITHDTESPLSPLSKKEDASNKPEEPEAESHNNRNTGGLVGVLCLHKKKGPKKSLKWRDSNLEEVRYFELDETERVNVTKNFSDMKQMEHHQEREAVKKVRNLPTDVMEEKIPWRTLIPIDISKDVMVDFGKNSKEKLIQSNRQASILQAIYFNKGMIPDFPAEADIENHPMSEPTNIPLDDVTGNPDSVNNFQSTPWPEPKVSHPIMPNPGMPNPQMYQNLPPFNPGFNNPPPFVMGGFQNNLGVMPGMPNEWPLNGPNMMMPDANMNPEVFMNGGPGQMFPGPMNDYPMMDNVNFPPGFSGQMGPGPGPGPIGMNRPMGPGPNGPGPGPYGFPNNRGGGVRGPAPRGGHMNWRSKGPGWNGPHRGSGGHRGTGRPCTHFQKKGFCRQGDSCPFLHATPNRSHY